jgi:outer membrane protein OmpA-like peptidoglycan-associated protein
MNEKPKLWEGFSFWPSFTDVMVVTLLIFLFFLFAQLTLNSQALVAAEVLRRQQAIAKEVTAALGDESSLLTIVSDGNLQRFQFSDRILFTRGEAELLPSGREVLRRVGEVLYRRADLIKTAQVEGHTDMRPIRTPRFPSNWELSSARATSVVRFLQEAIGFDPRILSANGYAEYRPVVVGDSEEAYAKNRRVELVLVYSTADLMQQALLPREEKQATTLTPTALAESLTQLQVTAEHPPGNPSVPTATESGKEAK